ncbi:MAG: HPP family protein [Leucobacter sp.]
MSDVDPKARKKQIIVGLVMGAVVGLVLALLTQFWLWLPAGFAMGLATGALMKPPSK